MTLLLNKVQAIACVSVHLSLQCKSLNKSDLIILTFHLPTVQILELRLNEIYLRVNRQ